MNNVFEEIEYEELTEDLKLIADVCGIESVRNMLKELSGTYFYVPKISRLDDFVIKYIKRNNDKSKKEIARSLNVSEQYLRTLIKRKKQ